MPDTKLNLIAGEWLPGESEMAMRKPAGQSPAGKLSSQAMKKAPPGGPPIPWA